MAVARLPVALGKLLVQFWVLKTLFTWGTVGYLLSGRHEEVVFESWLRGTGKSRGNDAFWVAVLWSLSLIDGFLINLTLIGVPTHS